MNAKRVIAGGLLLTLTACATPYTSRPLVMQGQGFNIPAYESAVQECRQMVERQADYRQADDAMTQVFVGALLGAMLGAALGAAMGDAGYGATVGTIGGGAAGLGSYGDLAARRQQVFNHAMGQCLSLKGYQVLGVGQ